MPEAVERVVDVLHLLACERVDVGGAGDALDERDDLVAVDAAVGIEQACRACHAEHSCGSAAPVAGRVSPRERSRMNAAWSSSTVSGAMPSSRRSTRRSAAVASASLERVVRVRERDAAPLADRLEAVVLGERLEQPERVERARDSGGAVLDAGAPRTRA